MVTHTCNLSIGKGEAGELPGPQDDCFTVTVSLLLNVSFLSNPDISHGEMPHLLSDWVL